MKDIVVVKFGGSLTKNKEAQKKFIKEKLLINKTGNNNILFIRGETNKSAIKKTACFSPYQIRYCNLEIVIFCF